MTQVNSPIRAIPLDQIPVFGEARIPSDAYLIMMAETYVEAYGCKIPAAYLLPINRLTPGATLQSNTYSLAGNGFNQEIPSDKVVPAYVYSTAPNDIRIANSSDKTTLAQFLILAKDTDVTGNYIVQSSGSYTFTNGHSYIVGKDYYLGADGFPTTERPDTNAQKLFSVLDSMTIMIDLQLLPDLPAQEGKGVC